MKKLLAATLLLAAFASPVFAKSHKANYKYKAPKSYKMHIHKQKVKVPHNGHSS